MRFTVIERTLSEVAAKTGGRLEGDGSIRIRGIAGVLEAEAGELTFVASAKYARWLGGTRASAALLAPDFGPAPLPCVRIAHPERAVEQLLEWFRAPRPRPPEGVDPRAAVDPTASIGAGVAIGPLVSIGASARVGARAVLHPGCHVGAFAEIGEDCEIHSGAVIGARVRLGARVVLQPNAVLGGDGFGFRPGSKGIEKLEHVGTIVVGDDVEIGSGTAIDRARFGRTVIGRGTKIDNLCQIAHNVRIGEHCVIAAQTGISGSTIVGDRCILGGQVGTVGHVRIGDGCMIAARSGISKDTPDGAVVYGFVAGPHLERKREDAAVRRLPALLDRVRELERRLGIDGVGDGAGPAGRTRA